MKLTGFGAALLLFAAPAFANDSAATLSAGGLEFIVNDQVEMLSEDLYISANIVRVRYVFRNNGTEDEAVLVGFPMPDIVPNHWSPIAYPTENGDNLFGFTTTFNGEPVEAQLHQYAYAAGVDRTKELEKRGLPLAPHTMEAMAAIDALAEEDRDELLHLGMLVPDTFDDGQGWETHWWPYWTLKSTYTWEAVFPAGETVVVEHSYTPSAGGTVGIAFMSEPYDAYDPRADYTERYCLDEPFIAAVERSMASPQEPWTAPYTETWLGYVLSTGANWGGPIGEFRLTIDKGSAENLVSFCWDGEVRKIGETTFEATATDFFPRGDLDILILNHQPQMAQ